MKRTEISKDGFRRTLVYWQDDGDQLAPMVWAKGWRAVVDPKTKTVLRIEKSEKYEKEDRGRKS